VRYVLFSREEIPDPDDLLRIANASGLKILDHTVPRVLLVEASEGAAEKLRSKLKKWLIAKEIPYSSPHLSFGKIRPEK
jgi:hypothetical protein